MTEKELRNRVVTVAQSYLGVKEGTTQHQLIIDTYNSYTPHPRGYKVTYTDAWCAAFVSAVGIKTGLTRIMPVECSCAELLKLYKERGRWIEDDEYIPGPGDLILYDWQDTGVGDNRGAPDHVGIVEKVTNNKTISVIEGNYSDMVKRRMLAVDSRSIRGYCCPDYASICPKSVQEITVENAVKDIGLASPEYWIQVLEGQRTASANNIRALMDKYHAALAKKK